MKQTSADEKSSQERNAVVELTAAGALLAGSAIILATHPKSMEVQAGAHGASLAGGVLFGHGFASLVIHRRPLESIERRLKEHDSLRTEPGEALADIERAWAKEVDEARRARRVTGVIEIGVGAVLAGVGTALVLPTDAGKEAPTAGFALIDGGAAAIVWGTAALVGESPLERSHRMWLFTKPPVNVPAPVPVNVPRERPPAPQPVPTTTPTTTTITPSDLPPVKTTAKPKPVTPKIDAEQSLYKEAHEAHFAARDPARALPAWDAYLAKYPKGRFAPEARYNRALTLLRLGRRAEAKAALQPFADGTFGDYRRREAQRLLDSFTAAE